MPWPNWREQLSESQALFSAEHELKGHVRTKVWGLSTSPLGDFIAACSSVHPSDMMEYGPPNDRRTTIAVSGLRSYDQQASVAIPNEYFSAEGLVFTLRKWLDSTGDRRNLKSSTVEEIARKVFQKHWKPSPRDPSNWYTPSGDPGALQKLVVGAKQDIFLNEHTIKDRCSILVTQICSPSESTDLPRALIAYRLAKAIERLPEELAYATPFSTEIRKHHRHVVALINFVMGSEEASQQVEASESDAANEPCDHCDFCQAVIPLTDLSSATCTNGHQFPRCGLSFLAIQAPRITKYCGLCKTPFLSEEFVRIQEVASTVSRSRKSVAPEGLIPSVETVDADERINGSTTGGEDASMADTPQADGEPQMEGAEIGNLPLSLARVLFLACDVCIYCGGKFTG
ncbi:hypothetical protein N0V90_002405 [Kalmusia sp. IMI 367209]|nr:hypothetical protein N0V90_002405 [Kalmusia sp. IMI 367209]